MVYRIYDGIRMIAECRSAKSCGKLFGELIHHYVGQLHIKEESE